MNLYLLRAPASLIKGTLESILIRARSERAARELASREAPDDVNVWLRIATCDSIVTRGNPGVILKSHSKE